MHRCLARLPSTSRSQRYRKLPYNEFFRSCQPVHDPQNVSTTGRRCFSKCVPVYQKEFGRKRKSTVSKKKEADNRSSSYPSLPSSTCTDVSAAWVDALERLIVLPPSSFNSGNESTLSAKEKCASMTNIIVEARESSTRTDILAELGVMRGRWPVVLSVVETLIADASGCVRNDSLAQVPSNLEWPSSTPLENMTIQPIEVDKISYTDNRNSAQWDELHFDPRYTDTMAMEKSRGVEQIWMSLGSIILDAADLPPEKCHQAMNYVYQIIAQLHNSSFIPEDVYSYVHSSYDSTVRRPPIMHLLYSRILTTLSDAVWRAHQDHVIAQAASAGATYKDLVHDPPGGRFRLKVRELGPEAWLEFVLWCCVDGGLATAGSWIVERMRSRNTDHPWFAARYISDASDRASAGTPVDWARVRLRHGGIVGQIEGYSREKPFVEMEKRTISVEVVLALVEASINARSPDVVGSGCMLESAQTSVLKLLMFLEPHNLPQKYFDYLTVRILEPLLFDFEKDCTTLQRLAGRLKEIRSLETIQKPGEYLPTLQVDSVLEQSEVFAGVLHQAFESLAVAGRVCPTVDTFNQIQELVDQSKLRSIGSFLHSPRQPQKNFFSSRDFAFNQEYTSSHGQLPAQRLAPLLDVITDAGLTELGKWLLYSMDVDGPLIPLSLYNQSSLSPSILRFAAATGDFTTIQDVESMVRQRPRNPPVNYLRSYADAQLQLKDIENAGHTLAALNEAKGGGNNLSNIAYLIATILRAEQSAKHSWEERRPRLLSPGLSLLDWVLRGDFRGISGDFRRTYVQDYRRGLACLLRVLEAIPETLLSDFARSWIPRVADSNVVGLNSRVFDSLLSAVVETRGAKAGMMLWDMFCEVPTVEDERKEGWIKKADVKLVSTPIELELQSSKSPLTGSKISSRKRMLPIRIDGPRQSRVTTADVDMDTGSTGDDSISAEGLDDDTLWNGTCVDVKDGKRDIEETHFDSIESPRFSTTLHKSRLAENFRASGPSLSEIEAQDSVLEQAPPVADISLPSTEFREIISAESTSPESLEDDVAPLSLSPHLPCTVVTPTFRTLRIIVRGALQELEAAKALWYIEDFDTPELNISEVTPKANMRALDLAMVDIKLVEKWAKPLFHRFGLSEKDMAVEFGTELSGRGDLFSAADLEKRYAAAKSEYELAKMGMLATLSEVNIRKRFLGPPIRKTEGNVKKYTLREVAFYQNKKNLEGKSSNEVSSKDQKIKGK
jgi:hypothetical protein